MKLNEKDIELVAGLVGRSFIALLQCIDADSLKTEDYATMNLAPVAEEILTALQEAGRCSEPCIDKDAKHILESQGYIHKDDPLSGFVVVEKCPECRGEGRVFRRDAEGKLSEPPCPKCGFNDYFGKGKAGEPYIGETRRSLTVGEALEMLKRADWSLRPVLGETALLARWCPPTLPNGGRIEVEDELSK